MTSASVSEVKTAPCREQLLLELHVVLDDPVDDDVDAVLVVEVRVGVLLGDPAVGGPAGVADAGRGRRSGDRDAALAVLDGRDGGRAGAQVADGPDRAQRPACQHGDARGVIAAVLELLEPGGVPP